MKDSPFRILLVEDNPGYARMIQEFLLETGSYDISFSETLSQGIEAVESEKFDVILLDLFLPDSLGLETLKKMRVHVSEVAIIVLTGLNDEEAAIEAVRTGAQDYLIKGEFEPALLSRAIQYALERKHLEFQLQQSHKMEAIGTLAGGIAHDFNNILGIILGNIELAMDDVPEWNPARDNLKQVLNACFRAKDVIRQLLSFCRKTEQKQKQIDIIPVIKETAKLLRASTPSTIDIRQNIPSHCRKIMADLTQIHQVLINLCTNATYAMREKRGELEISLEDVMLSEKEAVEYPELPPGQYVKLTVKDTGAGIPSEIMGRIFDPYFTTKQPGEGTGMGLVVVRGIVRNHGGEVMVRSQAGKGTCFESYFPAADAEEEVSTPVIGKIMPGGSERILLIDDEPYIIEIMTSMLERLGYQVTSMTSSLKALEIFRHRPDKFDLIITDMTMPDMTGIELAKLLIDIRHDIPIVLCTGFSENVNSKTAKASGIREYIMKPVPRSELAQAVRKALGAGH